MTLKGEITRGLPDEPYGDTVINDVLLGKASSSFPGNARNDVNVELGKLKKTPKLMQSLGYNRKISYFEGIGKQSN